MFPCLVAVSLLVGCEKNSSDETTPNKKVKADLNWPSVKFTEVRAYAWATNIDLETVVSKKMQPAPNALNPDGTRLSAEQVQRLLSAVREPQPAYATAGCYQPHNALIFLQAGKPVAYVEICFGCMNSITRPEGASIYPDLHILANLFTELKLPLGEYPDAAAFEKLFKKRPGVDTQAGAVDGR